jgi:signal transduction histidine kinase
MQFGRSHGEVKMVARNWSWVLLSFAVALGGNWVPWMLATPLEPWGRVVASLYYLPVVIAAASLDTWVVVLVGMAAGASHAAITVLGFGGEWIQSALDTVLYICVGLTASRFAARQRGKAQAALHKGQPGGQPEGGGGKVKDGREMPVLNRVILGLTLQFRTPVTAIEGAAWLLKDSSLPEEKRQELIGIVRKESHRLNRILSDALDFSHPRKPRLQMVDLPALLSEVLQVANCGDCGPLIPFHTDVSPGLPLIRCDPDQIKQALLNLVMNAVQASPAGGQIGIFARLEGSVVVITVKDSGKGIPAAERDKIFDPFFTTRHPSLGLGLPIALRVVTAHGGGMSVSGVPDRGTTVTVTLPVDPAPQP